jgi:hypothetical protein
MHTLIIAQNAQDIRGVDRLRVPHIEEVRLGKKKLRYRLAILHLSPSSVKKTYGGFLLGSAAQIVRSITLFADALAFSWPDDIVEFQVIFIYHQTSQKVIRKIERALRGLPTYRLWRQIPFKRIKHIRVPCVWMLSCESATDQVTQDARILRYIGQASLLRSLAQEAFITPQAPPPTKPPSVYHPTVVTFSTGDPVTGGLVLNPEKVKFKELPYRLVQKGYYGKTGFPKWDLELIPYDKNSGMTKEQWKEGKPVKGTLYKHKKGEPTGKEELDKNRIINILEHGC